MARRGRGGCGYRGVRHGGSNEGTPLPCIQPRLGETGVQLTPPTSQRPISSSGTPLPCIQYRLGETEEQLTPPTSRRPISSSGTPLPCIQFRLGETEAQLTPPTSRRPISSSASCSTSRNVRGSYKCISVDSKTKNGQKI